MLYFRWPSNSRRGRIHGHRCHPKQSLVARRQVVLYNRWRVVHKNRPQQKAPLASKHWVRFVSFPHADRGKNTRLRIFCKTMVDRPQRGTVPWAARGHLPVDAFPGEEDRVRLDAASGFGGRAPAETDKSAGDQDRDHISGGRGEDTGA